MPLRGAPGENEDPNSGIRKPRSKLSRSQAVRTGLKLVNWSSVNSLIHFAEFDQGIEKTIWDLR